MLLQPNLQIRANSVYAYTVNLDREYNGRSIQALLTDNLRKQETYSGRLCPGAKKRLIKAIDFMVASSKQQTIFNPVTHKKQPFKINFITLTVSAHENITGKEAHSKLLEPFLQWMRRTHNCRSYIWKAELQKRGQIHYHLTADVFIHWKSIRAKWNELQRGAGYLDGYYAKYGHYDPNSTDTHSTRKERNLSGYLIKEIAKSFQNEQSVGGKIWDCSMNLKVAKFYTVNEYSLQGLDKMINDGEIKVIPTDHCTIYQMVSKPAHILLNANQLKEYNELMSNVRNDRYRPVKKTVISKDKIVPETLVLNYIPVEITGRRHKTNGLFWNVSKTIIDIDISPHCFSSS